MYSFSSSLMYKYNSCCGGYLGVHGYVLYLLVELLVRGEGVVYHVVVLNV